MFLVDKEIREMVQSKKIIEPFKEEQLGVISYDLTIKNIVTSEKKEQEKYSLEPGEVIFIASEEVIDLPKDLLGIVHNKNSRIRQGLTVESPIYQPGHHTRVFFRIQNISSYKIVLEKGDSVAQISFSKTAEISEKPYRGSFSNEFDYKGMGNYESNYKARMTEYEEKKKELESLEYKIYGTIVALMAIFISVFALINTNAGIANAQQNMASLKTKYLLFNLSLVGSLSFMFTITSAIFKKYTVATVSCGIAVISFGMLYFL